MGGRIVSFYKYVMLNIILNLNVFLIYLQPSVELWNLRIDEPVTTATDLLMAAICFYAYSRIKKNESTQKIKLYFKYYFLTLGLGTMFGGLLGHAFLYRLAPQWKLVSWIFILISVAMMAHALIELARPLVKPWITRIIGGSNLLILTLVLVYTIWTLTFSGVQYYTAFGMIVIVGSFSFYIYLKTGSRGTVMFLVAVGVGLLPAFTFSLKWGLSPWFNHNDICHVVLSLSVLAFYKGASMILDAKITQA